MVDDTPCPSCKGRRWKYVSPRRGLLAVAGAVASSARVKQPCSSCWDTAASAGVDEVAS